MAILLGRGSVELLCHYPVSYNQLLSKPLLTKVEIFKNSKMFRELLNFPSRSFTFYLSIISHSYPFHRQGNCLT